MWQYSLHRDGGACIITLSGELDLTVGDALTDLLLRQVHLPDVTAVQVDLDAVAFLDSWIIGVLVEGHRAAAAAGRRFHVVHARGHVRRVLDVTGVLTTLDSDATPC